MTIRNNLITVGVVYGGPSPEAEVSKVSGREVAKALKESYQNVLLFELNSDLPIVLKNSMVDVVFPITHGCPGEDGTLQGLLEILALPYVGSAVLASACAMDKIVAKRMFRDIKLPVAKEVVVTRQSGVHKSAEMIIAALGEHVVLKPYGSGSGLGVMFVHEAARLQDALEAAFVNSEQLLVEEYITGKEITVAILERNGVEALPIIEITTPENAWYDYQHRYTPGLSEHLIPAPIPKAQYKRIQEVAVAAHQVLGCRDFSRVDFVVPDQGEPILLEVNTLPGMTPTSLYPDAARAAGLSFAELTAYLVERAWLRKINVC